MKKNTQRKIKDPQNDNWEPDWRLATFQGIHITFGYVMKNIHKKLIAILCFWLLYKSSSFTIKLTDLQYYPTVIIGWPKNEDSMARVESVKLCWPLKVLPHSKSRCLFFLNAKLQKMFYFWVNKRQLFELFCLKS